MGPWAVGVCVITGPRCTITSSNTTLAHLPYWAIGRNTHMAFRPIIYPADVNCFKFTPSIAAFPHLAWESGPGRKICRLSLSIIAWRSGHVKGSNICSRFARASLHVPLPHLLVHSALITINYKSFSMWKMYSPISFVGRPQFRQLFL